MINAFKAGDRVRCVRSADSASLLHEGSEYTVVKYVPNQYRRVQLEEIRASSGWNDSRFVLATPATDNIVLPSHYARFKIEPIRFINENGLDWFQGNVVKYVCRHDAKNGREDLEKAIRYLQQYIKLKYDNDPDWWKA